MTHYETLGVDKNATASTIKKAWRTKSREHHPDREGGDTEKMAEVNRAYKVLSDPKKRELYDLGGDEALKPMQTLEIEAFGKLCALFDQFIASVLAGDFEPECCLVDIRKVVRQHMDAQKADLVRCERQLVRANTLVGRIVSTEPNSPFQEVLNRRIFGVESAIKHLNREIECDEKMLEMLNAMKEIKNGGAKMADLPFTSFFISFP